MICPYTFTLTDTNHVPDPPSSVRIQRHHTFVSASDSWGADMGESHSVQQEALAPLSKEWNTLQTLQKQRLINLAKRYPQLNTVQKQRLHNRLEKWSKLTPEQRNRAREKFQAFSKVPLEKREQVKQMVRQQEAEKLNTPAAEPALTNTP